jgi:hypothetical protein
MKEWLDFQRRKLVCRVKDHDPIAVLNWHPDGACLSIVCQCCGKEVAHLHLPMSFNPETNESMPARRLMVLPAHEKRFKFQGHAQGITAVNDARSERGVYRWLKRNMP